MSFLEIDVTGEVERSIGRSLAGLDNLEQPNQVFAQYRYNRLRDEQFESESDPYDQKWTPLSAAYARYKSDHPPLKTQILQASGDMRATATFDYGSDYAAWGFNSKLAEYHQDGAGSLPVRQLVETPRRGLASDDEAELYSIFAEFVSGAWEA